MRKRLTKEELEELIAWIGNDDEKLAHVSPGTAGKLIGSALEAERLRAAIEWHRRNTESENSQLNSNDDRELWEVLK